MFLCFPASGRTAASATGRRAAARARAGEPGTSGGGAVVKVPPQAAKLGEGILLGLFFFGLFNGGLIERQEWNGVALETLWRADLGGYCTAAQLVPGPKNAADLAVAVTGTAGKSSIWVFDP